MVSSSSDTWSSVARRAIVHRTGRLRAQLALLRAQHWDNALQLDTSDPVNCSLQLVSSALSMCNITHCNDGTRAGLPHLHCTANAHALRISDVHRLAAPALFSGFHAGKERNLRYF